MLGFFVYDCFVLRVGSAVKKRKQVQMRLPVTVYSYDRHSKRYVFESCLAFYIHAAQPPPVLLTCGAGLGFLVEGMELFKAAMRAPALILRNGHSTKVFSASGDEIHPVCIGVGDWSVMFFSLAVVAVMLIMFTTAFR
jgi:hypothetical protein